MKVIVSDTSVIIDLAKVRLIEPALLLPYEFVVPDIMYEQEWLDLGSYDKKDLVNQGLGVIRFDPDGVSEAFAYGQRFAPLSVYDCFAMTLARRTEGAVLLTGDGNLTRVARRADVEVRGLIWICDQMNEHQTISSSLLHDALVALDEDEFVRVPRTELRKLIKKLR